MHCCKLQPVIHQAGCAGPLQAVDAEAAPAGAAADAEEEQDDGEGDAWEDPHSWSPEELCRVAEGTILFADVNLRADTAAESLLFHQVNRLSPVLSTSSPPPPSPEN